MIPDESTPVIAPHARDVLAQLGWRYWLAAAAGSLVVGALIGIPTDVLPNPWFTRMTPVRPLDLVFWPVTSVLVGLLLATYLVPGARGRGGEGGAGLRGGLLGGLAIGCPICNKVVVAVLGVSGALTYFGPIQPFLGLAAVSLTGVALVARLRALVRGCRVPATHIAAASSGLPR